MINIIFLLVTLVCLGVIGFIIWSKFPQLCNLDVVNLPQEKTSQKKQEIILKRIEANTRETKQKLVEKLKPFDKIWRQMQLKFRIYVGRIEKLWHHEQMARTKEENDQLSPEEKQLKIRSLIQEGEQNLRLQNYDMAEQSFISAVKMDVKAVDAYRGLGETYLAKQSFDEAKQTFLFLLQFEPDNDSVLVKLGDIAEEQNNIEEAIEYYERAVVANDSLSPRFAHLAELLLKIEQYKVAREAILQAVELEPQNPKYLDLLIETAILCQDKKLAEEGYGGLRAVNPENSKLNEFRTRIFKI